MILGIDYGRAKIGLARAEGTLAEPWRVIRVSSEQDALKKVEQVVQVEQVAQVVVGVSEGEMGEEQKRFATELAQVLAVPVETQDEGLSTQDAQVMARTAGIPQKKRQKLEDAYAATIMLQSWLEAQNGSESENSRRV